MCDLFLSISAWRYTFVWWDLSQRRTSWVIYDQWLGNCLWSRLGREWCGSRLSRAWIYWRHNFKPWWFLGNYTREYVHLVIFLTGLSIVFEEAGGGEIQLPGFVKGQQRTKPIPLPLQRWLCWRRIFKLWWFWIGNYPWRFSIECLINCQYT